MYRIWCIDKSLDDISYIGKVNIICKISLAEKYFCFASYVPSISSIITHKLLSYYSIIDEPYLQPGTLQFRLNKIDMTLYQVKKMQAVILTLFFGMNVNLYLNMDNNNVILILKGF